ncbi:hypothetical protein SAMN04244560_00525 [Thermoanaerobacter thermohydrosulfuricus]|jgi:cell division septal protein FtsQ|uniref:Uncharacterized protein n=4 Tax=Thermoanaerobacter TaxID=1754 RepID=I9KWP6_9THEO|nr:MULTISPECIES: hypothetical protein [Thermoanaerobacter]EGD52565.1 hypothetical protein TheetDRAFT_0668 [Thermoanaerobacter ethanolicus JW 200]KUJ90746.1 MAG: hypothetical protein XD37_1010 [Thermoanaerobacter thermocopriae]HAA80529.1 hypothetical protein [Thermoanaerobacter sp.]AEM78466.1 hypothetical protein Thewi_1038 [Thermoanaerobacter wiegelii Rt8.B1]EIW01449.1 hypothetical protein ThesiDRAFT1_2608 [Thermoanaerobacter siderophilus SR4]
MRLTRTRERKKQIQRKRLVIFALLLYIVIMVVGLVIADSSFNEITTGVRKVNIFGVYSNSEKVIVKIFGKESVIDIGGLSQYFKGRFWK